MARPVEWWYMGGSDGAQPQGAVTDQGLAGLCASGAVDGMTFVWRDGLGEWMRLSDVEELRELIRSHTGGTVPEHQAIPAELDNDQRQMESVLMKGGVLAAKAAAEKKRNKRDRKKLGQLKAASSTAVYVTGLPSDVTETELKTFFEKCGVIKPDPETLRPSITLYEDELQKLKGDALIVYALAPSVDNALLLLDDADLRPGTKTFVKVTKAESIENDCLPGKPKRTKGSANAQPEAAKALVKDALSWADEDERDTGRGLKIVVLRGVFDVSEADGEEWYEDVEETVDKRCTEIGPTEKVTAFRNNVEGVVAVRFRVAADAARCIQLMNGRELNGHVIQAFFFDGKTDYRHKETEEEKAARQKEWEEWLGDVNDNDHAE